MDDMSGMDMGTTSTMAMVMSTATSVLAATSTMMSSMDMGSTTSAVSATSTMAMDMVMSTTSSVMDMVMSTTSALATTTTDAMAGMDMSATTSSSSSSSTMDMSSDDSMSEMYFHTSISDYLFSTGWTPSTRGRYAGTCIFLIVLAVINTFVHVFKFRANRYLNARADRLATVLIRGGNGEDTASEQEKTVSAGGAVGELASAVRAEAITPIFDFRDVRPWRLSVDVPLALLQLLFVGISYLLMLAAMTFNVGYFLSILAGFFLGELLFGRFVTMLNVTVTSSACC
ncbi:Ctr copper transporter family-domain-containing protein [Limtongia smithiae]|uniref:Ctr copper transporter family-domain-containing protein n=1 Tax=Limtongia smithiae TaxID=1125753 RepID=UPI0034CF5D0E